MPIAVLKLLQIIIPKLLNSIFVSIVHAFAVAVPSNSLQL